MALTHTTTIRNALANLVVDAIDAGTTNLQGDLVIMAAADAEVATLNCANPAFGDASNGTATANAISDDTNATGGTAIAFKFQDRDGTEIFRGSVSTSGADLNMSSTTVGATDTVSVTSFSYTASL